MLCQGFQIGFSGLSIAFRSDFPLSVAPEMQPFAQEDGSATDSFHLALLQEPMEGRGELLHSGRELLAYAQGEDRLFLFRGMQDAQGRMPACRITARREHELWLPPAVGQQLSTAHRLSGLLCIEQLLLHHRALLFHSSVVCHKERVLLFSGPSGIGKSTQARLWEQCFGAKTLNGDRCVLRLGKKGITGGGSPWCGSSGIYDPACKPVQGIILLRQGKENQMELAKPSLAFKEIYQQCVIHPWDTAFVKETCDLIWELLQAVPVWTLTCRPDAQAAELAHNTAFGSK